MQITQCVVASRFGVANKVRSKSDFFLLVLYDPFSGRDSNLVCQMPKNHVVQPPTVWPQAC
jgi:hypothetical protein